MVASVQGFGGEGSVAYDTQPTTSGDSAQPEMSTYDDSAQPKMSTYDDSAQPELSTYDASSATNDPALYAGPVVYGGGGGVQCPTGSQWLGAGNYCISENVWSCSAAGATGTMVYNCGVGGCAQFAAGEQIPTEYGGGGGGTCPTGYDWGGPGDYCMTDNIYYCDASGGTTTNMKTNCGSAGCQVAAAGTADYCKPNPPDAYCSPITPRVVASNSVCAGPSFTHVPGSPNPGFYTPESCGEAAQFCYYNQRYSYNPSTGGCLCAYDECNSFLSYQGWNVYEWQSAGPAPSGR